MIAIAQPMAVMAPSQTKNAHHEPSTASTTPGASDSQPNTCRAEEGNGDATTPSFVPVEVAMRTTGHAFGLTV